MPDDETPDPTPQQDARVRRLLAEARHDEPVPPDVAQRLDAVLADLGRERAASTTDTDHDGTAPVVDLATRRRRRRVTAILAAAAAVVVVGAGAQLVHDLGTPGGMSSAGSGASATSDESAPKALRPSVGPRQERAYAAARVPRIRPATFRRDAVRAGLRLPAVAGQTDSLSQRASRLPAPPEAAAKAVRLCAPVHAGPGRRVPVRYAGRPSVLVVRSVEGDTRVIDLYPCGGDTAVRSVTLPAG